MHEDLISRIRYHIKKAEFYGLKEYEATKLLVEAADAIEELQAQLMFSNDAAKTIAEKVPKWISVTERLPDYPGRFMCYYEVNDYGEIGHCIDWGRYDPDDGWYVSGVTHWMPLPQPPVEDIPMEYFKSGGK